MSYSTLVNAQLNVPLRSLALTVEEPAPGEFCWRILESHGNPLLFESVACSDITFSAYDTALATGYGELQRLIGPDLQYGPRSEEARQVDLFGVSVPSSEKNSTFNGPDMRPSKDTNIKPDAVLA